MLPDMGSEQKFLQATGSTCAVNRSLDAPYGGLRHRSHGACHAHTVWCLPYPLVMHLGYSTVWHAGTRQVVPGKPGRMSKSPTLLGRQDQAGSTKRATGWREPFPTPLLPQVLKRRQE